MSIVVLGGTGFIGRHVCEALQNSGQSAVVLSHRPDTLFLADHAPSLVAYEIATVEARAALAQARIVFHLGHRSRPASNAEAEPTELEENVLPATRLFTELARDNPGVHVVYASSGGQIYGPGHDGPISETAPSRPVTPYALGKHMIEQCLGYFAGSGRLRATILRIANPVGRWQLGGRHGFVSAAVACAISGRPLTLYGAGGNVRDYFDARDLGELMAAMAREPGPAEGVFNIGSGIGKTEKEVLAEIRAVLGREVAVEMQPGRPFDMPYAVLDVGAARRRLGWAPRHSLDQTMTSLAAIISHETERHI